MKKKYVITTVLITIVIILIIIAILFSGFFKWKQYIQAVELEDVPDSYINISENEIQEYSALKKAIESPGKSIEISSNENDALLDLFNGERTNIKYRDIFYQIQWST